MYLRKQEFRHRKLLHNIYLQMNSFAVIEQETDHKNNFFTESCVGTLNTTNFAKMVHAMKTVVEFFSQEYIKLVSPQNFGLPCSDPPGTLVVKFYVFSDAL